MMFNKTLYFREMKKSLMMLVIFMVIITMYVSIIIGMYNPETMKMFDSFFKVMPDVMSAVGMKAGATSLLGFMVSYLYGFILLIFPMVFSILRANGLVAKYADSGAMAILLAAPIKRRVIAFTQAIVLITGVSILIGYATILQLIVIEMTFPGEVVTLDLLILNLALFFLHLFIAGICFLASCIFNETKYSLAFGAGIPMMMYLMQMISNLGKQNVWAQYFTVFSLFNGNGIVAQEPGAFLGAWILLLGAIVLFITGISIFSKKDISL